MDTILPYYGNIDANFHDIYPRFFDLSETQGFLFLATFVLSLFVFLFGRLLGRIFNFQAYDAEKYRVILLLNIFYIIPFIYGFIGGRLKIINIFLLFIGSGAYYAFHWIFSNPDAVINYFS